MSMKGLAEMVLFDEVCHVDPISKNVQLMVIEARTISKEQGLDPGESIQYFVALVTEYLDLMPAMHENQDPRDHDAFMQAVEDCCLYGITRDLCE